MLFALIAIQCFWCTEYSEVTYKRVLMNLGCLIKCVKHFGLLILFQDLNCNRYLLLVFEIVFTSSHNCLFCSWLKTNKNDFRVDNRLFIICTYVIAKLIRLKWWILEKLGKKSKQKLCQKYKLSCVFNVVSIVQPVFCYHNQIQWLIGFTKTSL